MWQASSRAGSNVPLRLGLLRCATALVQHTSGTGGVCGAPQAAGKSLLLGCAAAQRGAQTGLLRSIGHQQGDRCEKPCSRQDESRSFVLHRLPCTACTCWKHCRSMQGTSPMMGRTSPGLLNQIFAAQVSVFQCCLKVRWASGGCCSIQGLSLLGSHHKGSNIRCTPHSHICSFCCLWPIRF